jgi:hypothetical protein
MLECWNALCCVQSCEIHVQQCAAAYQAELAKTSSLHKRGLGEVPSEIQSMQVRQARRMRKHDLKRTVLRMASGPLPAPRHAYILNGGCTACARHLPFHP